MGNVLTSKFKTVVQFLKADKDEMDKSLMMVKDELEKVKEWHRRCAVSRRGRRGAIVEVI